MKKTTQTVLCLILLSSGMSTLACSPNLPNYQNCINQQRQSMEMQQFQGRMQQEQSLGQQQRQPYRQPYDPYAFEKATIQARQDLAGQSDIAVAFSPSTGGCRRVRGIVGAVAAKRTCQPYAGFHQRICFGFLYR